MIQLISKLKKHFFRTFQSLRSWPIRSRVITGFLQLRGSRGSLVFYLVLVSISFVYASRNPVSMGLRTKHKLQKADTYKHNQTYKRLVRMAAPISYSVAWSVGSPSSFVCVSTSRITWINGSVIQFSKQIAPNKWRM